MTKLSPYRRIELAHRSTEDLDVTLVWVQDSGEDKAVVWVCDRRERAFFEIPAEPYLALDVYYHPFAYREFSIAGCDHLPRGDPVNRKEQR
jgi:hypothetical protein